MATNEQNKETEVDRKTSVEQNAKARTQSENCRTVDAPPPEPCIAAYYRNPKIKPTAFLKALREAQVTSFSSNDTEEALQLVADTDPTLSRTVALLGKGPDTLQRWLNDVAKMALSTYFPDPIRYEFEPAKTLFGSFIRASMQDLVGNDKQRKMRAQNLLRLCLVWLVEQRNLKPSDALLPIRKARKKEKQPSEMSLHRDFLRLLKRAKTNQMMDLSLVASVFEIEIAQAERERREAIIVQTRLRENETALEAELSAAKDHIEILERQRVDLSDKLVSTEKQLHEERELRALDRTQQEGRSRRFLTERLSPLLSDARDALDSDPPSTKVARQRVEMAIEASAKQSGVN